MKLRLRTHRLEDGPGAGETHNSVGIETPGVFLWRSPDGELECYTLVDDGDDFNLTFSYVSGGDAGSLVNMGLAVQVEAPRPLPGPERLGVLVGGPADACKFRIGRGPVVPPALVEVEVGPDRVHRYQLAGEVAREIGDGGELEFTYKHVGRGVAALAGAAAVAAGG